MIMKLRYVTHCLWMLILCGGIGNSSTGRAAEYLGAEKVLRQAMETNEPANARPEPPSPQRQWRADLKSFQTNAPALAPAEAAAQWLKLLDRFTQLPDSRNGFGRFAGRDEMPTPQELMEVLPPPATWPELARQVEQRPTGEGMAGLQQTGLRMLVHTLTGDAAHRREDIAALQVLAAKAKTSQAYFLNSLFQQLNITLLAMLDNPDAIIKTLERQLTALQGEENFGNNTLQIPDLVTLVGREKAEAFLREALVKCNGQLQIESGTATQKLAQDLALELVKDLKKPQWSLVNSLEAVDLYEAMDKRFSVPVAADTNAASADLPAMPNPVPDAGDYEKQTARVYYFLGLIAKGRVTNAVLVAGQFEKEGNVYFPDQTIREMERAGFTLELNNFFHEQLQQNPELPFWDEYVMVAAHAGQTAEMVNLVRAAAAKPDLSKGRRFRLQQTLSKALLADDQVDAGVAELRSLIQAKETATPSRQNDFQEQRGDLGLKLARIGKLLNQTNWLEEGIAVAKAEAQHPDDENNFWGNQPVFGLAAFLRENGRGTEAESVLATALANEAKKARTGNVNERRQSQMNPVLLAGLARIYHEAGRPDDVLKIFDQAPYWGAKDVAQLPAQLSAYEASTSDYYDRHVTTPVGFYAAAALAQTGHPVEARKLLDSLFDQSPGCDRLYELLLTLDDEHAPAELDAIFARDQFEERPLIWKAHWLRQHQQLEAAEKVARQAISIDPTDGEEGPGDRLRAYAELAEIRAARGDQKEAETLRGAVQAVRQAELADQFHAADLLKRAIDLYTDSLNKFADAYCIHARLAVQLSDMGKFEEAAEHYRRAYELMPDSFGRVESHCFGCERAFDGERAQGIAEKVFTQLAAKTPNKPQIHYLLGYLREEQSRYQEALDSYRTAVKLDPDYLNAWVKMESVGGHLYLPPAERDAIVFNILRLDPMGHRETPSFELVSDLTTLWNQVAELEKKRPVQPDRLYPLAASAVELEKSAVASPTRDEEFMYNNFASGRDSAAITPGKAISQNGYVQTSLNLLGREAAMLDDE